MGEEERFAAALEYGTTPASMGGVGDSADDLARELELVALLRSAGPALTPEPGARERARQRLMAAFADEFGHDGADEATGPLQVVAPVALASRAETRTVEPTPLRRARSAEPPRRAGRHSAPEPDPVDEPEAVAEVANVRRLRTRQAAPSGHRRAALLGAAAAATLVALAGTSTFASRDALPGDTMYGVKRVAESTGYALTFSDEAKARRRLEQAQRRLDEVEGMVARDRAAVTTGGAAGTTDPELVRSTMQEFDADAVEGSRLLLAGSAPDTAEVDEVRDWATEQSARLSEIRSTLPTPDRADESLALLDRMLDQTAALGGATCDPVPSASDEGTTAAPASAACAPATDATAPDLTGTPPTSQPDDDAARGASGTPTPGRTTDDEPDGTPDEAETDEGVSVNTTARGAGSTETREQRRPDDGSDGDGSGDPGGSNDVNLPLGVPASVPSVGGLPGVDLGGR
jgi:hypothetical protein